MHFYILMVLLPLFVIGQRSNFYSAQNDFPIDVKVSEKDGLSRSSSSSSSSMFNQYKESVNEQNSLSSSISHAKYLVGNLSESYSFQVAPPSVNVSSINLNGHPLYIIGIGFSKKSNFIYNEKTNNLTILSLDLTTVGYYVTFDNNWQPFLSILTAINVSSFDIENFHSSEENNLSSSVSCSVSIIRSTFKLFEPSIKSNSQPLKIDESEYLPRLDLLISTRTSSSILFNKKIYNDTSEGDYFRRRISIERPLTRADHNGTIQCQIESNNNVHIYLIKNVSINIEYGPNLETGALSKVYLRSEVSKTFEMECQIEANPSPSYVWYEISSNTSSGIASEYEQERSLGHSTTNELRVFANSRQIQRTYEHTGNSIMKCEAQSRGKTVKQEFVISIHSPSTTSNKKSYTDGNSHNSYKSSILFGIMIGAILLLLVIAIIITTFICSKRRKISQNKNHSSIEKLSNDKQGKTRWGTLPIDYSKYKNESLKTDSSSTSHLVESAETNSIQAPPPIPARPSPMISTHSSYRQTPLTSVSLSYRQASALPGFRPSMPTRSYSPDNDDVDEISTSINGIPLTINRLRTHTPLGSHKSLSESVQSLRSNQQTGISLPVKKRSQDVPPILPKREQKTPSPNSLLVKNDYQHHHYHNPTQLQAQQKTNIDNTSSEDDDFEQREQQTNQISQDSVLISKKLKRPMATNSTTASLGYNQVNFVPENVRRVMKSTVDQQMLMNPSTGMHRDEAPPSYHEVTHKSSPSHAYIYQEPTEV